MDELLTLSKVLGAAGGGTAALIWVLTRTHVLEAFRHFGEWVIRVRSQSADLAGVKTRLQIEAEMLIATTRTELTKDLKAEVKSLREEVASLHEEVARWMRAERVSRDEVHELRNKMSLAITGDRATKLLDALEKHQPEWFGQERRSGERREDK